MVEKYLFSGVINGVSKRDATISAKIWENLEVACKNGRAGQQMEGCVICHINEPEKMSTYNQKWLFSPRTIIDLFKLYYNKKK